MYPIVRDGFGPRRDLNLVTDQRFKVYGRLFRLRNQIMIKRRYLGVEYTSYDKSLQSTAAAFRVGNCLVEWTIQHYSYMNLSFRSCFNFLQCFTRDFEKAHKMAISTDMHRILHAATSLRNPCGGMKANPCGPSERCCNTGMHD